MIDASKLLSRPTSRGLSKESVQNLVVIKKKVIEVDNLLKDRLVLRKVREGILRQQEERERRFARETTLEKREVKEKDSDYDITNPTKAKKGTGGLIGGIVSTVLGSFNLVAFSKIGALLKIGKLLKLLISPKALIVVGALNLLTKIVSNVSSLRNIPSKDLNAVGGNKVQSGFESFQSSLEELSNALVITAGLNFATARINKQRLRKQGISETSGQLRRTVDQIKADKLNAEADARVREAELDPDLEKIDRRERRRDVDVEVKKRAKKQYSSLERKVVVKAGARNLNVETGSIMGGIEEKQFIRKTRINPNELLRQEFSKESRKIKRTGFNPNTVIGDDFIKFLSNEKVEGNKLVKIGSDGVPLFRDDLGNFRPFSQLTTSEKGTYVGLQKARRNTIANLGRSIEITPKPISKKDVAEFLELREITPEDKAKRFSQAFGRPTGADPKTGAPTYKVNPRGREVDPATGMFRAKTKKISAEALTGATQKAARKSIMEGISLIPFIGDLIGLLIDIFVFGEPPGRAAFMAVGGALGGFLGALLGGIGGPPGAIVASILGGIAGDLLGGLLYDVLFRSGRKSPFLRLPKIGLKEAIKKVGLYKGGFAPYGNYVLGEQGREFVLDADSTKAVEDNYPGFLSALNKSDYDGALTVLRSHAFYETGAGFERMVPIPIPIQAPSDPFVRTNTVILPVGSGSVNKTYFQLYRRG